MKFAIVFVSCVLVLFRETNGGEIKLPQEVVDLVKGLSQTCAQETTLAESELAELRKGKVNDDPNVKCYLKCMMRQLQAMREDGTLDIELIDASMPDIIREHGGMETVEKCKHIQEADMCETAYQLILCFKKENPSLSAMFEKGLEFVSKTETKTIATAKPTGNNQTPFIFLLLFKMI